MITWYFPNALIHGCQPLLELWNEVPFWIWCLLVLIYSSIYVILSFKQLLFLFLFCLDGCCKYASRPFFWVDDILFWYALWNFSDWQHGVVENETSETSTSGCGERLLSQFLVPVLILLANAICSWFNIWSQVLLFLKWELCLDWLVTLDMKLQHFVLFVSYGACEVLWISLVQLWM